MKRAFFIIVFLALLWAQSIQNVVQEGQKVYNRSCATGYCHAVNGEAGAAAPQLAARGFDQAFIINTISRGVPGTPMPPFANSLSREDFGAVVAYVSNLNGIANPSTNVVASGGEGTTLSRAAERGRDLFLDAVRGFGRCSTCHEVSEIGISVAPITTIPVNVQAMRTIPALHIVTVVVEGETMPALVVSRSNSDFVFYDLTTAPPVLRTVRPADAHLRSSSNWQHSSVIESYSDEELDSILAYLRLVVTP